MLTFKQLLEAPEYLQNDEPSTQHNIIPHTEPMRRHLRNLQSLGHTASGSHEIKADIIRHNTPAEYKHIEDHELYFVNKHGNPDLLIRGDAYTNKKEFHVGYVHKNPGTSFDPLDGYHHLLNDHEKLISDTRMTKGGRSLYKRMINDNRFNVTLNGKKVTNDNFNQCFNQKNRNNSFCVTRGNNK